MQTTVILERYTKIYTQTIFIQFLDVRDEFSAYIGNVTQENNSLRSRIASFRDLAISLLVLNNLHLCLTFASDDLHLCLTFASDDLAVFLVCYTAGVPAILLSFMTTCLASYHNLFTSSHSCLFCIYLIFVSLVHNFPNCSQTCNHYMFPFLF